MRREKEEAESQTGRGGAGKITSCRRRNSPLRRNGAAVCGNASALPGGRKKRRTSRKNSGAFGRASRGTGAGELPRRRSRPGSRPAPMDGHCEGTACGAAGGKSPAEGSAAGEKTYAAGAGAPQAQRQPQTGKAAIPTTKAGGKMLRHPGPLSDRAADPASSSEDGADGAAGAGHSRRNGGGLCAGRAQLAAAGCAAHHRRAPDGPHVRRRRPAHHDHQRQPEPGSDPSGRYSGSDAERVSGSGGSALLPSPRRGHGAPSGRAGGQHPGGRLLAGGQHHHHAADPSEPSEHEEDPFPKGRGNLAGMATGTPHEQGRHSGHVSELHLFRQRCLRHSGGGSNLFRRGRAGSDPDAGLRAGGQHQGSQPTSAPSTTVPDETIFSTSCWKKA